MNNTEALQQLRDIHLPEPIPFWPPAPGWWLLAAGIVLLTIAAWWLWQRHRRRAYRRAALKELQRLQQSLAQGQAVATIIAELSILLRRAAISRYGRQQVAALQGMDWLAFLDRTGRSTQFCAQGQAFLDAPYRRDCQHQVEPLLSLAQRWLRAQT